MLAHAPVGPGGIWSAWSGDPLVVAGLVVASVLYGRGYVRRRRGGTGGPAGRRAFAFAGAIAVIAIALLSPLDAMADALLAAHMVQHLLLIVVAPPLLVTGRPIATAIAGLPRGLRRTVVRVRSAPVVVAIARALHRPVVAWVLFTIALWIWHAPSPYTWAIEHSLVHAVEHASFLLTATLGWSVALRARARAPLGALGRALFLVATAVQGGLLGAILLFAPTALYPVHGGGPATWGLTPLEDQQLAGALMWIPPSAVYLTAAAAILVVAFRSWELRGRADVEVVA
jgi:cytochrome c oxidase assembly factor CtaG